MPVRKNLVNTTSAQKRLAGKERPYTDLCPLRKIGIGLFSVLERQTRRRMSQIDFTTAELALHYPLDKEGSITGLAAFYNKPLFDLA